MSVFLLKTSLAELTKELEKDDITILLAGGYGLYLKQQFLLEQGTRTLLQVFPEPRSTQDLDLLISMHLLTERNKFLELKKALASLGYKPTNRNPYWQWEKDIPFAGRDYSVIIDLLTGDVSEHRDKLKVEGGTRPRRARPRGKSPKLHARPTPEALDFEERHIMIPINARIEGTMYETEVPIVSSLTYLCMKLYALRDRIDKDDSDYGRHHALDIYRVVGLMDEEDYKHTQMRFAEVSEHDVVIEAHRIVSELFGHTDAKGFLRIKEHYDYREDFQLGDFESALKDLFPGEH